MEELVSVIMPSYNSERFIRETVDSVLNQKYKNLELIVVDDCSTDGTFSILQAYAEKDARVSLLQNEKNSGAAASRNYALRQARGKWIAFLDSDDVWLPEKLEKQIAFMRDNASFFSYTKYEHIDEHSVPLQIEVRGVGKLTKRKLGHCCYPGCLTVMYDAEKIGLLQIPDEIANGENDYALWLKAIKKADCDYLDETLSLYRVVGNSLSHKSSRIKILKNHYAMYRLSENCNAVSAFFKTLKNAFFTAIKKAHCITRMGV